MLLEKARSQLLVVDIQDKLIPAIADGDALIRRTALLMQAAERLGVPITISEHNPKSLGATVAPIMNAARAKLIQKMHFSCAADDALIAHCAALKVQGRDQLVIAGVEAHICVLQSALGFLNQGFKVFIIADAVSSFSPEAKERGLARARDAGCLIADTEMAAFEWMHLCGTPEFRSMLDLIKAMRQQG